MGWVRRYAWNGSWSVDGRMPLIHMSSYECHFSRSMRWNYGSGKTAFEEKAFWLTLVLAIFIPDEILSRVLLHWHFDISDHRADNPRTQTVQWLRFPFMHDSVRFFVTGKLSESVVCCSLLFYFGPCFRRCHLYRFVKLKHTHIPSQWKPFKVKITRFKCCEAMRVFQTRQPRNRTSKFICRIWMGTCVYKNTLKEVQLSWGIEDYINRKPLEIMSR